MTLVRHSSPSIQQDVDKAQVRSVSLEGGGYGSWLNNLNLRLTVEPQKINKVLSTAQNMSVNAKQTTIFRNSATNGSNVCTTTSRMVNVSGDEIVQSTASPIAEQTVQLQTKQADKKLNGKKSFWRLKSSSKPKRDPTKPSWMDASLPDKERWKDYYKAKDKERARNGVAGTFAGFYRASPIYGIGMLGAL